jgi:hypothetical protein
MSRCATPATSCRRLEKPPASLLLHKLLQFDARAELEEQEGADRLRVVGVQTDEQLVRHGRLSLHEATMDRHLALDVLQELLPVLGCATHLDHLDGDEALEAGRARGVDGTKAPFADDLV